MLSTPDTSHVGRPPYLHKVYEPAEDTFALLDALEQDRVALQTAQPRLVVEIGSGSGCVSAFLASVLREDIPPAIDEAECAGQPSNGTQIASAANAAFLCTDINPLALEATLETAQRHGIALGGGAVAVGGMEAIRMDTISALKARCRGQVDVLLFNPPYVPTIEEEETMAQAGASIEGSWAGGALGRRLVDALLPDLPTLLAPQGRVYLVAIRQNEPEVLVQRMEQLGLQAEICLSRRAGREHLFILRAIRP